MPGNRLLTSCCTLVAIATNLLCLPMVMSSKDGHHSVVGYITIRFEPQVLRVRIGESMTAKVHVTVHVTSAMLNRHGVKQSYNIHQVLNLRACSNDPDVATITRPISDQITCHDVRHHFRRISYSTAETLPITTSSSKFDLTIRGERMGRTRIKFYLIKTDGHSSGHVVSELLNIGNSSLSDTSGSNVIYVPLTESDVFIDNVDATPSGNLGTVLNVSKVQLNQNAYNSSSTNNTIIRSMDQKFKVNATSNDVNVDPMPISGIGMRNVSGNKTTSNALTAAASMTSTAHDVELWWIAHDYEVTVISDVSNSTLLTLRYVVLTLTAIILVALGGQVDFNEMTSLVKQPSSLVVAIFCRHALMPAVGLMMVELFQPTGQQHVIGTLCLQSAPSEGASILLSMLVGADVTMAVLISILNSISALAFLPLWTILYSTLSVTSPDNHEPSVGHIQLPLIELFVVVSFQIVTVCLGHVISRRLSFNFRLFSQRHCGQFCFIVLVFGAAVDLVVVSRTWTASALQKSDVGNHIGSAILVYVVLGVGGYVFGTTVAYLSGRQLDYVVVIGLETGARTTYVVSGLIAASFAQPDADLSLGSPAFCAAVSVISAATVGALYRTVRNCRVNFRYAEAACKLLPVIDSGADDVEELCLQPQLVVA